MMSRVTGTGCQLSALMAAYVTANPNTPLQAAAAAVCAMGLCGEVAFARMDTDEVWSWKSDGSDGYTVEEAERAECGTTVILTLKDNTEQDNYDEFLEEYTLRNLVKKYSDYIRYPIRMPATKSRMDEENLA